MAIKCKIIFERDPETLKITDKIKLVKAPNGKRSLLFDSIRDVLIDDKEALNAYYKVYTDEFKDKFGDWENIKPLDSESFSILNKLDSEVDDLLEKMHYEEFGEGASEETMSSIYNRQDKIEEINNNLNNSKLLIKNIDLLNNINELLESEDESNQSVGLMILNGQVEEFKTNLDQNGEPKYNSVKDIILPTDKFRTSTETNDTIKNRGYDPQVRDKYFHDGDTQSHSVILQRIIDNDNIFKPLAQKLLTINGKPIPVTLVEDLQLEHPITGDIASIGGAYYSSTNKIEINESGKFRGKGVESTLIHEILHGFTVDQINKNTPAVQELNKIYEAALEYADDFPKDNQGKSYALSNLDEFIVAIYSDGPFIKTLMTIPSIGPNKSLWDDILQWMKELFNFNKGERSLFDDAFYVSNKIIEDYSREQESLESIPDTGFPSTDVYADIGDLTIEDQFNLRNEDGSRKRYNTEKQATDIARNLNKENKDRPFKFTVIKVMGEKGDNRVYYAVKSIENNDEQTKLYSLGDDDSHFAQPDQSTDDGVAINIDIFKDLIGKQGYTQEQIDVLIAYNQNTSELRGDTIEVNVADLPWKLRQVFEKKGMDKASVYAKKDGNYVTYRVSNIQDLKKVKHQSKQKAEAQEQNPKSVLAREMGTKMHELNEIVLRTLIESDNKVFKLNNDTDLNPRSWVIDAMKEFKNTKTYEELKRKGKDIFLHKSGTTADGSTYSINDSDKMVDKLVESMMRLYHQSYVTQNAINRNHNLNNPADKKYNKPIFLLEKPFMDLNDMAGTMDVFVIFSDGTASIYDHKFTDMNASKKRFDKPSEKEWNQIKLIREAQGLSTKKHKSNYWYWEIGDKVLDYRKEDSWNTQIGKYSEMALKLYKVKGIRQARILPVATKYELIDTGKKNKDGKPIRAYIPGKSKVESILTGYDDLGTGQIALEVEETGDVQLDRFIKMLIDQKHDLNKERVEKKAYNDPKYIDRINKLNDSIQALLIKRDINEVAVSIQKLAEQIESDLTSTSNPISFEQIIHHLRDIKMFEQFIDLSANEINNLENEYKDKVEAGEENPYTTFKERLESANFNLARQASKMHNKMTSMIFEENEKGGFMSKDLFATFQKQVDMSAIDTRMMHLRESNHPIISLFSQLLDRIDTNVINERRELEVELNRVGEKLKAWGRSKGLTGTKIYEPLLTKKKNLIFKYTNYKQEVFPGHSDPKNRKANIKWFKENFERVGRKEEIFQNQLERVKDYFERITESKEEYDTRLNEWLNRNDIKHNNGDNEAWFNPYVQHWLTPKNPGEYYTEEYKELLKPGNEPLLEFYNIYTDQMAKLYSKADFRIKENFIPEIRKDMIDTMVQDGIMMGWRQQMKNVKNYFTETDKDDGFHILEGDSPEGKKVPIFFTDSVGADNKSLDLSKSLMIFSDFVNRYSGIKDAEHSVLAMRELVAKTQGVKATATGKVIRDTKGDPQLSGETNKKLLESFDRWIDYYIYGVKKEGDPLKNKIIDTATSITSRKSIALNWLSAIGGHINAEAQENMIAKKATYFTRETLSKARKKVKRLSIGKDLISKGKDATQSLDSKMVFASMFFEISQEDLGFEKANSVSLDTMRNRMNQDYAYMLQRWSDDVVDNTVLCAMMMDYGIDPLTGKTYPLSRLEEMYKDSTQEMKYGPMKGTLLKDIKFSSLWDMLKMEDQTVDLGNGYFEKVEIGDRPFILNQFTGEKIEDRTFTDFRRKTKSIITRVKGNMSADDIAGYKTHMLGRLVMQFRGWIPATVRERAKKEQYNLTMEQFEVGRWWAAYDMVGKNLKRTGGQFLKDMTPFMKGNYDINDPGHPLRTKYDQFIADNPHLKPDPTNPSMEQVTYEQYFNTYVSEVRALAKEVQTYLALAAALGLFMLAGGSDEIKENPVFRLPVTLLNRAMLEIGFFLPIPGLGFEETTQMFKRAPFAAWSGVETALKAVENTGTELYDTIFGAEFGKTVVPRLGDNAWEIDVSERVDRTGWGYYSHQFIPPFKFAESILGSMNISKRKDTVYDYLTDQGTFIYK